MTEAQSKRRILQLIFIVKSFTIWVLKFYLTSAAQII